MKISVRRGVFETNSSSSHALVVSTSSWEDSKAEISRAIRHGLLDVGWTDVDGMYAFETFMDKLAYLTELRICEYCMGGETVKVSDVKACPEIAKWEGEVIARLAERGVHCDGFQYDSMVDNINSSFGLDHQVVECGSDSVGEKLYVDENRWVRKTDYGWYELCGPNADGAVQKSVVVGKRISDNLSDMDVLFDDRLGIRYGWDSDDVHYDPLSPFKLKSVLAEVEASGRQKKND